MLPVHALLSAFLTFQTPAPAAKPPAQAETSTSDQSTGAAERAASSAERAAAAAERAAEANARMAEAIEQLAKGLARTAPPAEEAPPPETPAEKKAEEKAEAKKDVWDVTVGLGLIFITGNASTVTFNGLATAERKTEHWIYAVKATGVYGESRPPGVSGEAAPASTVTALGAAMQLRADRRFTQKVSGYLLGSGETDHVKSVEFRGAGEAGLGIIWWDLKRKDGGDSFLRTDVAFRYAREMRFQYYPTRTDVPDVSLGGPRFGAAFRYSLNKDIAFLEELSVLPSLIEGSRLLVSNQSQLNVKLTQALAVSTTFLLQYDSQPAPGRVPTDTSLAVSLAVTF